jgi:hypothetical protein
MCKCFIHIQWRGRRDRDGMVVGSTTEARGQYCFSVLRNTYYLMNINKDIFAFYWLRFVMWFYFIFHDMTTKSSKEAIIYHVTLHWPVDIDRLKKKWNGDRLIPFRLKYGIVYNYCSSLNTTWLRLFQMNRKDSFDQSL